jgi:hypothetical protein
MTQYQGVWTLQNAAQLQSTQRWVTDPLYKNTTLLLQADDAANGSQNNTFVDSSGNGLPINRLPVSGPNAPTQGSFTPFSQAPGYWGNYFDGSGDYLSAAYNSAFAFPGDFTIEFWVNWSAHGSSAGFVTNMQSSGGAPAGWQIIFNGANDTVSLEVAGSYPFITSSSTLPKNTWAHVAVVRSGSATNNVKMYFDGVQVAQGTNTSTLDSTNASLFIGCERTGGAFITGYMSNVRIVKGTAVYTSAFTPPTAPLTAITNTSLLTCQSNRFIDNSTNAFAITGNGNASVQPFSPFAPQYQWTPSVIGGSGYFDGSTDNIQTTGANTNLSIGTGDFTFECWAYLLSASGDPGIMQLAGGPFGTNLPTYANSVGILVSTGSGLWLMINNGGFTAGSISARINQWTHLAVCRSGTTHRLFVNGVQALSVTDSSNYTTQYFAAGCAYGTNFTSNSYISNIRFVRGTAVYTGAFTPPTRPLSASGADSASAYPSTTNVNTSFAASATSLFLNFTNAGIVDATMKNNLETVGNAQVSTAVVKYGSGSMFFDGTGDYLRIPTSQTNSLGSGDWTIEFWIYRAGSGNQIFYDQRNTATQVAVTIFNDGNNILQFFVNGANRITGPTFPSSIWTHVAVSKFNSSTRMFVNGVQVGSTYADTNTYVNNPIFVGAQFDGSGTLNGYIDDLRVTLGIARYTQNFIPPSVALPRQ